MTYLLFAVLVMTVGISVVVVRNRPSTSMEASIDDFQRGLRALAPEADDLRGGSGPATRREVGSVDPDPDPEPESAEAAVAPAEEGD